MYRISFYGDRQPENLPDSRGQLIYDDYKKGALPIRVELRAGFTIESKSIRDIEFIPDSVRYPQGPTNAELRQFEEKELKRYLNEKGELTPWNEIAYLVAKQLVRVELHAHTYHTASDATLYIQTHKVKEYQETVELLSNWKTMKGKENYAEKMKLEELERTIPPKLGAK